MSSQGTFVTTRLLVKPSPALSAQFFPPGRRQALGEEMKVDGVWCVKREFKCYQPGASGLIFFSSPGGGQKEILAILEFWFLVSLNSLALPGRQAALPLLGAEMYILPCDQRAGRS